MENDDTCGPCLAYRKKTECEELLGFDLTDCSEEKKAEFILSLITEHHTRSVQIEVDLNNKDYKAEVKVSWNPGCEQVAQKVIRRVEKLSTSK